MDLKYYKRYYCKDIENVENFEKAKADNFVGWCIHHRLQTWTSDGELRLVDISASELKALDMYYNRPASELIFLTESEHQILHTKGKQGYWKGKTGPNKGKQFSAEARIHMSESGKRKHLSEEHKKKIGETKKGNKNMLGKKHSAESKKKMSEAQRGKNIWTRGRHWYNNGKENKYCYECPEGFVPGMLH